MHILAKVGVIVAKLSSEIATSTVLYTNLQPEIDPPGTNLGPYNMYGAQGYSDGVAGGGQVVSIYGKGFGPPGTVLSVQAKASSGGKDFVCANPTSVADADHGLITCDMPPGYGTDYYIYVAVFQGTDLLETANTCGTGCTPAVAGGYTNCDQICLKFQGPILTSATPCPTNGGSVTVTGLNFGPAASGADAATERVLEFGTPYTQGTNLTVVDDTTIIIEYNQVGTGVGKAARITIAQQTYPDDVPGAVANILDYAAPTITGIVTTPAWNTLTATTDTLSFSGTNFGPTPATAAVTISGDGPGTCTPDTSSTHFLIVCQFTCASPCIASLTRTIGITVDGQSASFTGLSLIGPSITSVGTISMFGSDLPAINQLTITGQHFGSGVTATGVVTQVEVCKYTYAFQCTSADWQIQSGEAHVAGSGVGVTSSIVATIAPMYGANLTVRALFSGGTGAGVVNEYTTGGEGLLNFYTPQLFDGTDSYDYNSTAIPFLPAEPDSTNAAHKLSVSGKYFGALGATKITGIVWDGNPTLLTAANSQWAVDTVPTVAGEDVFMSFFPPSGVGKSSFSVFFSCDGVLLGNCTRSTNFVNVFRDPPQVATVTSVANSGGSVTLTGSNFGPVGTANVDSVVFTGVPSTLSVACENATVVVANTEMTCDVPAGVGYQLSPTVTIAGIPSADGQPGRLIYDGPVVTSVSKSYTGPFGWNGTGYYVNSTEYDGIIHNYTNTIGNWVTITGRNFGPPGYFYSSFADRASGNPGTVNFGGGRAGISCSLAAVTVFNTEIQCLLQNAGAGAGYDVYFDIYGQDSFGDTVPGTYLGNGGGGPGAFDYLPPTLETINSVSFLGGDIITITGINFGPTLAELNVPPDEIPLAWNAGTQTPIVQVTIGTAAPVTCAVTTAHLVIECVAPVYVGNPVITDLPLLLNIEGQTVSTTYSFLSPEIISVSTVSFFGGPVTVTGRNFGNVTANIESIIVGGEVQNLAIANPQITVGHTVIVFTAEPSTIGEAKDILINIRGVTTGSTGDRKVVFQGPQVTSSTGGSTAGGIVTVTGLNFGPVGPQNIQRISIADKLCTDAIVIKESNPSELTCIVGPGSGLGYDISVRIGGVVGIGTGVYSYGKPYADTIVPMNPPPRSRMTLIGGNYGIYQDNIEVTVSGLPCTDVILEVEHTSISCITPFDTGGDKALVITVDDVVSDPGVYTYAYPNITSVSGSCNGDVCAESVSPAGGNLTIHGENFGPVGSARFPFSMGVTVGLSECYFPYVIEEGVRITCVLPEALTIPNGGLWLSSDLAGDGLMTVNVTIDGLTSSEPDIFSFAQAQIFNFEPVEARSGDNMIISGKFLGITRTQLNITIDGREVIRYFSFQSNSVGVQIPPGAGTNLTVQVFVADREATYEFMEHENNFTYLGPQFPLQFISESVPAPTLGGLTTIAGRNLGPLGRSDHIDYIHLSNPMTGAFMECVDPVVTTDDTAVTCTVPEGIGGGWDVSMSILGQLDDGSGQGWWGYRNPYVTRVSPRLAGPGTTIFVEGQDFGMDSSYLNVSIVGPGDSEACLGVICSESRLSIPHRQVVCIVPESVGAYLDVIVEVASLRSNITDLSQFSFPHPIIRAVSMAPTQGGVVTVTGQGFGPGGECYKPYIDSITVGGDLCTDPLVIDDSSLTCVAPPGVGRGYDVIVTLRGSGSQNTGFGLFQYAPPNITSVRPPGTAGGDLVIFGENFGPETVGTNFPPTVQVWREEFRPVFGVDELVITEKEVTECVVEVDNVEIRCEISAGIGSGYNVRVVIEGLDSLESGYLKMDYAKPIVDSVKPQMQNTFGPTTITVSGRNFGSPAIVDQITVFVDTYEVDKRTIRMWDLQTFDDQYELTFTAPSGAGINLPIYVHISGLVNEPNLLNGWFSYSTPAVLSVTPVPTQGGICTITGVNFGPLGTYVSSVELGDTTCDNARVTVQDTEIQCNAGAGVGADLDVRLKINQDAGSDSFDSGRGKFRYRCPVVTGVSYEQPPFNCESGRCQPGPTGQKITIYGNNFGEDIGNITVKLLSPETTDDEIREGQYKTWVIGNLMFHPDAPMQPNQNGLYTLQGEIPVGYARNRLLIVTVLNQDNVQMCANPLDVEELITTPAKFSNMMFSYARPDILSTTTAPTGGGLVTVFGRGFGPLGTAGVSRVMVENWEEPPQQIVCENYNVTQENVEIQCDMGAGEGGSLNIWTMVGGQESGLVRAFTYDPPQLRSINPTNVAPGDFVTVLGTNLGADPMLLAVELFDERGNYIYTVPRENVTMATAHTQILFPVPFSAGRQRTFVLKLPAPEGVAVPSRNVLSSANDPASELYFNYFRPTIEAVTASPSAGGAVTMTGTGFGAADDKRLSVESVLLGAEICADVDVTVDDVELVCIMPSGAGGGYDAFVTVDGQDSEFLFGAFSYAVPIIDTIEPPVAAGGQTITLNGDNFGIDARNVEVELGNQVCSNVALLQLHTQLTCMVPTGVSGRDVGVSVTVQGVSNNATESPAFTYSYLGCTYEGALNYDPEATEDDGTCIIEGCIDPAAPNFDPMANQADDSCIRPPRSIFLTLSLPYPTYLRDPNRFDEILLEEVRRNLGLETVERIMIMSVSEGSTVWELQILDEPTAVGQRNDELTQLLQAKIAGNTWTNVPDLGEFLKIDVKDGQSTPIVGKAAEPRVSAASISAIAIGGLILILWAVFWRQILRWCAKLCSIGDDEEEEALDSAVFQNQLYKPIESGSVGRGRSTRSPALLLEPGATKGKSSSGNQIVPYGGT